ncbi:MAG: endonuclease V [Methanomassiliicoccus sp.]|nr:endonuclease V [Methanomassiliicoccus sp.]
MLDAACEGPDMVSLVHRAVGQIPPGMVSTFGDIASALGDRVASRAVGEVLSRYPALPGTPTHRVVHATGRLGPSGEAGERAAWVLSTEGVTVVGGMVRDIEAIRFTDFHVDALFASMRAEQETIRAKVIDYDDFDPLRYVAGLDVSYSGHQAFAALSVHDASTGDTIEERTTECVVRFPYVPTYLSFRELPVLRPLITKRANTIYLIDGHGALHPRGAGIASHIGVLMDVPTVGAAKSGLVGKASEAVDGRAPIILDGEVRGYRIGSGTKMTYVSVGHRVSLGTAVALCERLLVKGIPAPLQRAHDLAGLVRRSSS